MNSEQLLKEGLSQLAFSCSKGQINAFMTFLHELKKWNRAYNLTALKTEEDIIIKHFLDSLLYLKAIPEVSDKLKNKNGYKERATLITRHSILKLCDVGTGAGFPGIPIKIVKPETDITLIEPSRKKTAFLKHIIRILKLNRVSVFDKRIELLGKNHEKTYDVIVSRATFKLKDFIKKACPYLKEDGRLVLSKGPKIVEEEKKLKNKGVIMELLRLPLSIKVGEIHFRAERNLLILKCDKA